MKKRLLFIPTFGAISLTLVFASSCSSAIKYRVEFIGDHLHFKGEGNYTAGSAVIGNIYADDGYSIPSNIDVAGVKDFTYDSNKGDVSFVINHNVIITADACYSFKFFGNNCIASGEGFEGENEFEYRFDYLRSKPLDFLLASIDEEHVLSENIEITFNGEKGKNGEDYIYDTLSKTLKVLRLSEKIEARASSDSTYPLLCNFEHCSVTGLKERFREKEHVNFIIDADPGYDLPESVTVDGADFVYERDPDDKAHATFVLINGMPNKRVILTCGSTIRSYSIGIQGGDGHYYFETTQTTVKHGEWFLNYLKTNDTGYALPENISVSVNGKPITDFYYYSQTGAVYIDENIIDGPVIIETDLTAKQFPFTFTSSIAYTEGMQSEYPYGSQDSNFLVKLNTEYTYPILSYEVEGLSFNSDYTFDCNTGTFHLLKMPAAPVELKILSATPNSFEFTSSLTNCHFETTPKEKYAYGETINLKIIGDSSYDVPSSIEVTGVQSGDFQYDSETGNLTIVRMPAKSVKVIAKSTSEIVNIDSQYYIVINETSRPDVSYAHQINEAISYYKGKEQTLAIIDDDEEVHNKEIIIDSNRPQAQDLLSKITNPDGYAIKAIGSKIVVVGKTGLARMCAIDRLLTVYLNKGGFKIPVDIDITGTCAKTDTNLKEFKMPGCTPEGETRDPFIIEKPNGYGGYDYYLYGTMNNGDWWKAFRCKDKISESTNDWANLGECCVHDELIKETRWAPEVYEYTYNGETNYYMFTTYKDTGRRGVVVMKSSSLEPSLDKFKIISYDPDEKRGFITPRTYDGKYYIDGSLYVDENGIPWLTYVDNFRTAPNNEGGMLVARITNDLTRMWSTPVECFKARDASWVGEMGHDGYVTDGPFIYRCKSGRLIMQWSSYTNENDSTQDNYALGFATSDNGSMVGPWAQHRRMLFEKNMYKQYTGGHGHFFVDHTINQMYLCCHSPNSQDETSDNQEHPILIPVKEAYDTLVWDIYQH